MLFLGFYIQRDEVKLFPMAINDTSNHTEHAGKPNINDERERKVGRGSRERMITGHLKGLSVECTCRTWLFRWSGLEKTERAQTTIISRGPRAFLWFTPSPCEWEKSQHWSASVCSIKAPLKALSHSTESALIRATNDLLLSSDHGCISLLVLLDLSAAFDTIDHNILLNRIENSVGISGSALAWFKSYLSDRHQFVAVNEEVSYRSQVQYGVP